MVGIFSKFSVSRAGHRRTQSALEQREVTPPSTDALGASNVATPTDTHGVEVAIKFKPVEHPIEPLDNDKPVQCPLPEPSIINDGRIWKERVSAVGVRRTDVSAVRDGRNSGEGDDNKGVSDRMKPRPQSNRMILPSMSAPEHNILKLLEECNASGS